MKTYSALAALVLFFTESATAQTTNDSVESIIQGRKLALQLLEQRPPENTTQTGILKLRDAEGNHLEIPIKCEVTVTPTNWQSLYEAVYTNDTETLAVTHSDIQTHHLEGDFPSSGGRQYISFGRSDFQIGSPNGYTHRHIRRELAGGVKDSWKDHLIPFAGSDFWECDLGLEFLHWPRQKILKKEFRRQCACMVLESTNPHPTTNGYSRVVSWIDEESLGIVEANAYDANGKKLKNFYPKNLEKVNGQYQVQSMIMDNLQTGSRTRLEFDLKK